MDCLQAALEYAAIGIRVFPVRGKSGCPKSWPTLATCDEEQVAELWANGGNVAALCGAASGIVDLNGNGPEAEATCRRVFGGEIPVTWSYRSRRGLHWWFRWREGLPIKARVFVGTLEIITGNNAAYTVAPPSVADGIKRVWLLGCSPGECELAEIPDAALAWMVNFAGCSAEELDAPPIGRSSAEWEGILRGAPEGARNDNAASLIGQWLRGLANLDDRKLVQGLWEHFRLWNERNAPPLPEPELRQTFESIYRAEQRRRVAEEAGEETAVGVESHTGGGKEAGGGGAPEWRLVVVESDPPRYELHAPQFAQAEGGCLVLTAQQMCSGSAIRIAALEQASYPLTRSFVARWDKRQRRKDGSYGKSSLYERLILAAERRDAPPEEQRWRVVAQLLLSALRQARELEAGNQPDPRGRPCRLDDGSVVFGFTRVWEDLNFGADRVKRPELTRTLRRVQGESYPKRYREGGVDLHRLDGEDMGLLRIAATGDDRPAETTTSPIGEIET